ncbi:MAG: LacI family DNA-binding transcriptional regulator [Desulfobacterales bacterium]|nr:LacI family DNA-binding transcriptional regulator [Desulfobacterales bacterium]
MKKEKRVTIKDVAGRASVSIATVSHVINETRFVSDDLKGRILAAIEETDYQLDMMAGSLRKQSTRTVGLIVPDISNPIYAELSKLIENNLFADNFTLILCNSEHDPFREKKYLDMLRTKRVDGVIVIPASADIAHINALVAKGLPMVVLDRPVSGARADAVFIDHERAVFDATQYLVGLGHRRIGYLDKSHDVPHKAPRLDGFHAALKVHGIDFDDTLHVEAGVTFEDGASAMGRLLQRGPRPTAVIAFDDVVAMGAMRACRDRGLDIPDDISVVGFDDMPLCAYTVPRLTTVKYPRRKMAETACALLLERIRSGMDGNRQEIVLPLEFIVRESTAFRGEAP